ncbi:selection and upkeep of intraepithelial T-cells protein 5-like [Hippoglossus hippoglossus]|uniref:selection and upkeep of intraepithelial T-cells protein 5-like n=1 Tax=Hippoglossus hippoglossus TaxID=8267 RepID=UPI00148CF3BC|nr:selection and upkeep of intraepithelial T-cells protein 5-like [Hippoglossus hippoglossus]
MNARLVLVAALLSSCSVSGETSDDGVQKIQALAGEAVVLPCKINAPKGDVPTVEWSKEGLDPKNITFLYRNHFETFEMKNLDFQFRTSLFLNEVKDGNISLRISNVRPSDAGKHECSIFHGRHRKVVTTLELIVCAATEPKLSVVPGDVETLQCEVNSSLPQLHMTFLDHQEKVIDAEDPKQRPDSSGCFTFTGRVTVPTESDRVTCRVHQPHTNYSRDAQIYFTAKDTKSSTVWSFVAVAVAVGFGFVFLLCFFRNKIYSYCAGRKTPPESNQPSVQSTSYKDAKCDLRVSQTDSSPTVTSELLRKMEGLESQLQEKEGIISRLTEELKRIRSTQSSVTRQPDQPTFDVSPSQPSPDTSNFIYPNQFPNGNNPKPGVSSNNNPSESGSLSQEKDTKPGVRKQTAAPNRPMGRRRSPSLSPYRGLVSSDPTQNTSENGPVRRSKSLNRFSVLADLSEDST